MFKLLLEPLEEVIGFFRIFKYITFRSAYAAVTALLISFLFGPFVIDKLRRLKAGESIRNDGPKTHLAKAGTPTMGGVLIIISIVVSVLLWQDLTNIHTWVIIFSTVAFGLLGFVDDYMKTFKKGSVGMQAGVKFTGQIVISSIIVLVLMMYGYSDESNPVSTVEESVTTQVEQAPPVEAEEAQTRLEEEDSEVNEWPYVTKLYVPFFKFPVLDMGYFYFIFAVFVLLATTNAVNLTDGLDGLAAGLVIIVGLCFTILTYITHHVTFTTHLNLLWLPQVGEITIFCLAMVGAVVGFLWYNSHPAEVMMGDTGALSLGGAIGVIALMIKKEILLLIVGGVFALEAASVIIQVVSYKMRKKRVFKMAPLHHHFEESGWPESKVVIRFWILGGLFAIIALSTLKIQ